MTGYLDDGVGICQMPCPEQRAWGGVLKRRMLLVYGSRGTWRSPAVRVGLRVFLAYTRHVYRRLAKRVAAQVADYEDSGMHVVAIVGVAASPACGVETTLDVQGACKALRRCPLAQLDGATLTRQVVSDNSVPGRGMFVAAVERELARRGIAVPFEEHAFPEDSDINSGPGNGG